MKGLQIKCQAIGGVGRVEFINEDDQLVMSYQWAGEQISHTGLMDGNYNKMTEIANSIRDLAMKIGG